MGCTKSSAMNCFVFLWCTCSAVYFGPFEHFFYKRAVLSKQAELMCDYGGAWGYLMWNQHEDRLNEYQKVMFVSLHVCNRLATVGNHLAQNNVIRNSIHLTFMTLLSAIVNFYSKEYASQFFFIFWELLPICFLFLPAWLTLDLNATNKEVSSN